MMNSPILQLTQVGKRYGRVPVLSGVSFFAEAGEAIALWGANGAGKTTLLKAILGLIDFTGEIRVGGHDVRQFAKQARRQMGYVPQEAVYYDMSVLATLEFYARLKKADPRRIQDLLTQLGLVAHLRKPVPALSGGLKQRLALAIALLGEAPILLLDEPTANLDVQARREYLSLLVELRKGGKTLIFASHRLEEVEGLADRLLVMQAGNIDQELQAGDFRRSLVQDIELTLWVPEAQRQPAVEILLASGLAAHLNGRGTVVVRLPANRKLEPLVALQAQQVQVLDFEVEQVQAWS